MASRGPRFNQKTSRVVLVVQVGSELGNESVTQTLVVDIGLDNHDRTLLAPHARSVGETSEGPPEGVKKTPPSTEEIEFQGDRICAFLSRS
jgi:hypothetical protein